MRLSICVVLLLLSGLAQAHPPVNGEPVLHGSGCHLFRVQGEFRPTIEGARESALRTAQDRLREWLLMQSPKIHRVPGIETIRRDMHLHELPPQEEQIAGESRSEKMYKITIDLELSPQKLRDLRAYDRMISALWTLGGILVLLGAGVALLRVDEWTKGFLTSWLKMSALVIGCLVILIVLRLV